MSTRIEYGMPDADYRNMPGLSHSAMKDLAISPFQFWQAHVNPEREADEPTPAMIFGSALHSAVLDEESVFDSRFCCEYVAPADALDTVPQLREWYVQATGSKAKGTTKEEVAAQVRAINGHPAIVMDEQKRHFAQNDGKRILKLDDWDRLSECTQALTREPEFQRLRQGGKTEVSYFVTDPDTGVALKARMDLVAPAWTCDPKTYTLQGKEVDRTVNDAIYYQGYHRQAYLYTAIRHIAGDGVQPFINAFVQSEQPHEVRLKKLTRMSNGQENLYWSSARLETQRLIRLYADCVERFGDKPWRTDRPVESLMDEDIRALAYA